MVIDLKNDKGIVVLTNGANGLDLASRGDGAGYSGQVGCSLADRSQETPFARDLLVLCICRSCSS